MSRAAAGTPALIRFAPESARADAWGRLTELTSTSACVAAQAQLARHERVLLRFDFAGRRWKDLGAEVVWTERDADGYCAAELRFLDKVEMRRLAAVLAEALAR